jgi:hypothetical protein
LIDRVLDGQIAAAPPLGIEDRGGKFAPGGDQQPVEFRSFG